MKKCILICNLKSGKGLKSKDISNIIDILDEHDYETEVYFTKKLGDAKNKVLSLKDTDLVLSVGGDGTYNEVIGGNYLRKDKILVAHVPVGTTNDIGHMLGMKRDVVENVKNLLNGKIKQVDIGLMNNRPFIYVAGFGKFINVSYATKSSFKKVFGHLAYLMNGVKDFFRKTKLYEMEYTIDGVKRTGAFSLILISNSTRIAGFSNIYKDIKLDDDLLEVTLCKINRRTQIMRNVFLIATKGITNTPGFECYKAADIEIKFKSPPKLHWAIDGEENMESTDTYKFGIEKSMKLLLPTQNLDKLFIKKE